MLLTLFRLHPGLRLTRPAAGEVWKGMSAEDKKPFEDKANAAMAEYKNQKGVDGVVKDEVKTKKEKKVMKTPVDDPLDKAFEKEYEKDNHDNNSDYDSDMESDSDSDKE